MSPGRVFAVPTGGGPPTPERRLAELGLELPALRPKAGRYEGWALTGDLLFLSGQGADGWIGRLGARPHPSRMAGWPPAARQLVTISGRLAPKLRRR